MTRVEKPAYRIDIRVNGGAWVDVSTAVQGAPSLSWELEESTGRLISDQLTVRCYVEFLDDCGLAVKDILDADDLGVRVAVFEAGRALSPGRGIVFRGRADEVARLSTHAPGDTLDITVLDLLASQSDTVAPASTVDSAPARYTDLLDELAGAVGLTVAESPPLSLEGDDPVISHHPSPSGDPTIEVRGLAWWANESLLVCGVGERIYAYDPATGQSYELAVPDWPLSTSPPRSIDRLWIDGDDLYGVALTTVDAGLTAESYIVKADLSSWSRATMSPAPVAYTAYEDAPLRLYNAGRVKIASKEIQFRDDDQSYLAWAQVIGAAGPEHDGLPYGAYIFRDNDPQYRVAPRRWEVRYYGAPPGYDYTTVEPGYAGRNLYLADETEVAVEYEGTGRRQADVVCYRQPGPLGYCVQGGALSARGGEQIYDLGNGKPDAERVGTLPLTLPPGYYSFISAGQGYDTDARDGVAERVDGFSIVFSQPQRRVEAVKTDAADSPLTAEDDVDPALFDKPLGPLVAVGNDEFERLYIRDVSEGDRVAVTGFPANAYDIHLARAANDEVYCVFARDDGLVGAYGRTEPLVETEVGVCRGSGTSWTYQRLYTLSGWNDALADNESEHSHYRPTCIAYAAGKLYFGVVETVQRFVDAGVRVVDAYTKWHYDSGNDRYYADFARMFIEGHHIDDFADGDRIRLWPDQPERFPYAPLPRTITSVEWNNVNGGTYQTELRISPFLDVSTGELNPAERDIPPGTGAGLEEYRLDSSMEWGPPTLQHEAAREQRARFYRLDLTTLAGLTEVDNGQVETTETVTPEVDGDRAVVELGNAYPTDVALTLGSSAVISTLDEDERDKTGTGRVYLSRRYAGLELTASYDYYDPALRFERALAVGETCYYTKGKKLLDTAGDYGDVHYQASGVVSPLVIAPTPPLRLYGVAEGGGGLLFQLSRRLSGFAGDRTGWASKPVPSCLSELALALGCVFWVDAGGGLHFVPRGWRRNRHVIAATEIVDYTEPGAWQVPASAVTVSWPGGAATVGSLSATRAVVNESFTADLVTSAGWAGLLADHLHERLTGSAYRAEATLRDIRLDIEVGDGVQLALTGAVSVDDGIGTVVGMSIAPGQTVLTVGA